jgi:hypothetical protein
MERGVLPGQARLPAGGVAAALLSGAVACARDCGAPALERYPVEATAARIDATFAYVGTTTMFEAAGFQRIAQTSARSAGLPRVVMRHGLTS